MRNRDQIAASKARLEADGPGELQPVEVFAVQVGVTSMTMFRWITRGLPYSEGRRAFLDGRPISSVWHTTAAAVARFRAESGWTPPQRKHWQPKRRESVGRGES
jgi:hypothetical protein